MTKPLAKNQPIPTNFNLVIAATSVTTCVVMLYTASHASHWGYILASAMVFALINNTVFSLLHEAVHGVFHRNRMINYGVGLVFSALFPTSFTIQKVSHLGHHKRNRTDLELYDYYLPNQSRWLKTYWLYCLLTGFYWSIIPIACILYLVFPGTFSFKWFQRGPARWWGFEPFVKDIADQPLLRIWLELLFVLCFQVLLWLSLDLKFVGWLSCYWAFALVWSAMQYVIHAWTIRNVENGAWNLRINPVSRLIFLNYTCHLAHHKFPQIPWIYLTDYVLQNEERPTFWKIYFSLWGGARPAPPGPGPEPLSNKTKS